MRRTNTFAIKFGNQDRFLELAKGCSALWNVVNNKRRQSFFSGAIDYDTEDEYKAFAPNIGSATTQQIIRKNDAAWKAFFRLLKMKKEGILPSHIRRVSPPGYWKDRDKNEVKLRVLIRKDCYRIKDRTIRLPKKIRGRIFGNLRWSGEQGTLEIHYWDGKWYAYMPVETQAISQPLGQNQSYVDIGIRYPVTAIIEGIPKPIAYDGSPLLSDWWYWNRNIAKAQKELKLCNSKQTSPRLKRIYRTRQKRFRQAVNEYIADFVRRCRDAGVSEIYAGDLTGIRNNGSKGCKTNTMINNFWSHKYLIDRLMWTAENYGIVVKLVNERGTSSICPKCRSDDIVRRGRLFKCKNCGLEAHRDVVGAFNIGFVYGNLHEGGSNRVMAHPEVVMNFCSSHSSNLEGTPAL